MDMYVHTYAGGSKLICLNEKGREFPKGLRVMAEPGESVKSHLHIEEDFNKVHVFGGSETVTLKAVEVCVCVCVCVCVSVCV